MLDSDVSSEISAAAHEIAALDRILLSSGAMLPTITMLGEEVKAISTGMIGAEFPGLSPSLAVPEWTEQPATKFDAVRYLRTRPEMVKRDVLSTGQRHSETTQAQSISNLDKVLPPDTETLLVAPPGVANPIDEGNAPVQAIQSWQTTARASTQFVSPTSVDLAPAPGDLAPTPSDLAPAPSDLAPTPSDLAPTPGDFAPTPTDLAPTPLALFATFAPAETQRHEKTPSLPRHGRSAPTGATLATDVSSFGRSPTLASHSLLIDASALPPRTAKSPMFDPALPTAPLGSGRLDRDSQPNPAAAMDDLPEDASVRGWSADTTEDPPEPQQGTILIDGMELGRWMIDHIADQAMRPYAGTTGIDPRVVASFPGAPTGG